MFCDLADVFYHDGGQKLLIHYFKKISKFETSIEPAATTCINFLTRALELP